MTDEYDWKRVQPILAWLREKNFVTVDEVHEELNRLLQAASQQPKKQATVYKWFTGENNPRKEKGSDSDIVESIVNSTLNVVRRRKPEHAEDIQEALYEQNPVHLRIIEGRGYPLPDECLTPSHAIKSFLGHFVLYRVGLGADNKSWELKQVPFRLFEKGDTITYEERFKSGDVEFGGEGYAYLLGRALTIFMYVKTDVYGEEVENLFFGSFNVGKDAGVWIGAGGYAGVFIASDDQNFQPAAHKAVIVRGTKSGVPWVPALPFTPEGWDQFKEKAQQVYPLQRKDNALHLSTIPDLTDRHRKALEAYLAYLNFNDKERANAFLYATYNNNR